MVVRIVDLLPTLNPKLTELILREEELSGGIPESLAKFSDLCCLRLNKNYLTGSLPKKLASLQKLIILDLSNNRLSGSIPESFSRLHNLQELWLNNNAFTNEIPRELSRLSKLRILRLNNNNLTGSIPTTLSQLSTLQELYLAENQLSGPIPEELCLLSDLQILRLNNNELTGSIPDSIYLLSRLVILDMNSNWLSGTIPESLSVLPKLQELHLSNNYFIPLLPGSRIKKKFEKINYLKIEELISKHWEERELGSIVDLVDQAGPKILQHVQQKCPVRVPVLGSPRSGKSTLIQSIIQLNEPTQFPEVSVEGLQVHRVSNFSFWDFGRQETLFSAHKLFLTDATQHILVVNLAQLISDNHLIRQTTEASTRYWMNELLPYNTVPVIIVGTHCDKTEGYVTSQTKRARVRVLELADEISLQCIPKVFRMGKLPSFKDLAHKIYNQLYQNTTQFVRPQQGFLSECLTVETLRIPFLRERLEAEREEHYFMSWKEYKSICFQEGLKTNDEIMKATRLLVILGTIVTGKPTGSKEEMFIILQPQWVAKSYTSIASMALVSCNMERGYFTREQLEINWRRCDIAPHTWKELERLLEHLKMIVRLPSGKYFIPTNIHTQQKPEVEMANELKEKLRGRDIQASDFFDLQVRKEDCEKILMFASVTMEEEIYYVALKMVVDVGGQRSNDYIISGMENMHPHVVRILRSFKATPTDELMNFLHPSIKELCEMDGEWRPAQFYIMERYEKVLKSVIRGLSKERIHKYALQLARGLSHLYQNNIVHLDMRTDNLMISYMDELVIVGFGCAGSLTTRGIVDINQTFGGNTPHLAPEVLTARYEGQNLPCFKQHSWELGMILFQMLMKEKMPFNEYGEHFPVVIPPLDMTGISISYRTLLSKLLCEEKSRISVDEACSILEDLIP